MGEQTGEAVYRDNDLDRGHLVRRLDPAWGDTRVAKAANDDTFHFTNAPRSTTISTPARAVGGLEDYVLQNADNPELAVTVFTGPVLAEDDDRTAASSSPASSGRSSRWSRRAGSCRSTGYLLSQASLIDELPGRRSSPTAHTARSR